MRGGGRGGCISFEHVNRCLAISALIRQSRSDHGLGLINFQYGSPIQIFLCSLGSGGVELSAVMSQPPRPPRQVPFLGLSIPRVLL